MKKISSKNDFFTRFPFIDKDPYGFSTGRTGWFKLIWKLCIAIEKIVDRNNIQDFRITSIKNKFDILRVYFKFKDINNYHQHHSLKIKYDLQELVDKAQEKSRYINETTGKLRWPIKKVCTQFVFSPKAKIFLSKKHWLKLLRRGSR